MQVERAEFLNTLTYVQPGLARKEVIEFTNSFIFHNGMVMTYNDEISVRHPLPPALKHLSGAVKAKELLGLVSRYRSKEIDVQITENEFQLKTKNSGAGVVCEMELPDFVDELTDPDKLDWKELPKDFEDVVNACLQSVGAELTRPALSCIHFDDNRAESTDTYRMTVYFFGDGFKVDRPFLLPGFAGKYLVKKQFTHYAEGGGWLHLRMAVNDVVFSCRTFEPEFPDLVRHLKTRGREFHLPDGLDKAIERACVFVEELDFESDRVVEIAVKENAMRISSKGPNGWFKQVLPTKYEGSPFRFSVNPIWLNQAYELLRHCEVTDSHIRLEADKFVHMVMLSSEVEE